MDKKNKITRAKSLIFELLTALFAWYVAHQLLEYEIFNAGILGVVTAILIFRLCFMSVKREDLARYSIWFTNKNPYPKNYRYVIVYFLIYLIFIIALRQATFMAIWVIRTGFSILSP